MILTGKFTSIVHELLKLNINEGSVVLDGTMGNGYDTVFMAKLVGDNGRVYSFDIQKEAVEITNQKLENKLLKNRVELINDTHTKIVKYVDKTLDAAVFNLGYLPGGDKTVITRDNTTVCALKQTLKLLKVHGVLIVTSYYGHKGGLDEKQAVEQLFSNLDYKFFNVVKLDFLNKPNKPPFIYCIEKYRHEFNN